MNLWTWTKHLVTDQTGGVERVVRRPRSAGYLIADEEPDVLVLRPSDLRQVPPAALIRCLGRPDIWMPTVEGTSAEGPVVGLLSHPAELAPADRALRRAGTAAPPPSAPELTLLLRYLSGEMSRRGHLVH